MGIWTPDTQSANAAVDSNYSAIRSFTFQKNGYAR